MKLLIIYILLSILLVSPIASADNVLESSILQFQLNRFYFPVGVESLIYKDCRFVIINESDTLLTGYIEASHIGVSYSYPVDSLYDPLLSDKYKVFIQPVLIDSLAEITIGYTSPCQTTLNDLPESGDRIIYNHYDNNFEMILDFESGIIDAFYSFSQYSTNSENTNTISFPAPYYLAIIPHPASLINDNVFLTTSLYYRYDPDLMPILFNGNKCQPINCLSYHEIPCERYYPYDPYRGQLLLKQHRSLPQTITIGISDQAWVKTAEYYADILSRDRVRTIIENNTDNSDFYLTPISYNKENKISNLSYIHNLLCNDTAKGSDINETINIIGDYIASAQKASDTLIENRYYHLAETALWDEIGVFPLYQPTIFFTAYKNTVGYATDSTGFIDQVNLHKIILLEQNREVIR